jgi:hypothetical protein
MRWWPGGATLLLLLLAPAVGHGQRLECDRCHGELELLRQQTTSLADAERLLAPGAVVRASAHGDLACSECHTGVTGYPHSPQAVTRSCASCHAAADSAWQRGVHANVQDRELVGCTSCHGVHDVASRAQLATPEGIDRANARCAGCHESQALPASDAHRGRALCAGCHGAHDVRETHLAASLMHPFRQLETCATCHDSTAAQWRADVHADTLRKLVAAGALDADPELLPGCTACHGAHGMIRPNSPGFEHAEVARCQRCHQERARTFFKSYHGKATALGSEVAASCAQCHGAHGIRPSTEPASLVHQANLVETCGACHENARPAFVKYDSHPDPFNRARNPWIFASFVFMNSVLIMTLLVFGLHTVLWWIRIVIDRRRGVGHGPGGEHNHRGEQP